VAQHQQVCISAYRNGPFVGQLQQARGVGGHEGQRALQ
jgi:hypothetical protein